MTKNESTKLATELWELTREFSILTTKESTPDTLVIELHTLGRMFQIMLTLHSIYDVVPIESLRGKTSKRD